MTNKNTTIILLLTIAAFLFVIPGSARAKLYRYFDDEGIANYTTQPQNVPEQYRAEMKLLEDPIHMMHGFSADLAERLVKCSREKWLTFATSGNPVGINIKIILWHCLLESMLAFWLVVELVIFFIFMFLLLRSGRWRSFRKKARRGLILLIGYLLAATVVLFVFVLPAYKDFLAVSRFHLAMISDNADLEKNVQAYLQIWDQKLKIEQRRRL